MVSQTVIRVFYDAIRFSCDADAIWVQLIVSCAFKIRDRKQFRYSVAFNIFIRSEMHSDPALRRPCQSDTRKPFIECSSKIARKVFWFCESASICYPLLKPAQCRQPLTV